jgi:hypothetical protein
MNLHCISHYDIISAWFPPFGIRLSQEWSFKMAKMRTLMADDDSDPMSKEEGQNDVRPVDSPPPVPTSQAPAWLEALAEPCQEAVVSTGGKFDYIGFVSDRSSNWDALRQLYPRIKAGDVFIGRADGQFELLDPLRFLLIKFRQLWTTRDESYRLEAATFDDPGRHSGLTEEFLAMCVVLLPSGKMIPTVSYYGGTKAGAIRPAAQALVTCSTPDWLKVSPAHAASAKCPLPFGRFITTVTIEPRVSRDKGRPYGLAVGHVTPTTLAEIGALEQALKDADFRAAFKLGLDVYDARLESLEAAAQGGAAA